MGHRITREEALEAVEGVRAHGGAWRYAQAAGLCPKTVQRRLRHAAEWGLDGNAPGETAEGFVISENVGRFDADGRLRGQTIRTRREPGEVYEVPPDHLVKGESAYIDAEGRVVGKWVKTDRAKVDRFARLVAAVEEAFSGKIPPAPVVRAPDAVETELCTLYGLADMHMGMHSWGAETGSDYDLKIAEEVFRGAMGRLIAAAPASAVGVLLGLGDITHGNDSSNQTPTSGNVLDIDSRHDKILMATVWLMCWAVEATLTKHEKVVVRLLKGNHDPEVAVAIAMAIKMRFHDNPRVAVDMSPSMFWFYRWGEVGIGATHGHNMKPDKMVGLLASHYRVNRQVPALFGRFYFGHIHHETVFSENGTKVESLPTLAAPDAYHAGRGWLHNERSMISITHHKQQPDFIRNTVSLMPEEVE